MSLSFEKWSGAGNDFLLIEASELGGVLEPPEAARRLCARKRGIGADGLILLRPGRADYWNCDGSPAAFCGNGARCVGAHLLGRDGGERVEFSFGEIPTSAWCEGGAVSVTVPIPAYRRRGISPTLPEGALPTLRGAALISAGVPHLVLRAERVGACDLEAWAAALAHHPDFGAEGVNVTLVDDDQRVRTWERGVAGETLACGSGCLAAARVLHDETAQKKIALRTKGGELLTVGVAADAWVLNGPALRICRGVAETPGIAPDC